MLDELHDFHGGVLCVFEINRMSDADDKRRDEDEQNRRGDRENE
jgi:hypothetical protein